MIGLIILALLASVETSDQPSALAVRGPTGPVEELRAWAEYAGAGLAPAATHLREDGG